MCTAINGATCSTTTFAPGCRQHHCFNPVSCLAFCTALDQHVQAYISSWGPLFSPVVLHWWVSGPSKAGRRNFMRTLVPKPLWSCLSQPIPGSTHAEHKATLGQALAERVKRMEGAVRQAHDWLCTNPLPWDPILWAHHPDPLNPFSVSHGAFSTSVPMPPRTGSTYQHPTPLPRHALKKPSKSGPTKLQPAIRRTPRNSKHPHSHASAPNQAPPSSAIPRPTQHSRPRHPQKRLRLPQRNQTTITWAPPKRTKATRPLSPPRPRARYRQTRLPLTSMPTSTRCNAPSAPPRHSASRDIPNFFRPSSDFLSPPLDPFDPLPLPEPPPPLPL